jgi:putative Mn2+ efflux pump MntP
MPVAGWAAGVGVAPLVSSSDHWIAFLLLLFVGARMVRAGLSSNPPPELVDPSRGLKLVMLSVATSIDALAIGLSLAMLGVSIWYPSFVIGVVTFALSLIGFQLGEKLGATFGRRMETASGVVLIGIHILVSHLLA